MLIPGAEPDVSAYGTVGTLGPSGSTDKILP